MANLKKFPQGTGWTDRWTEGQTTQNIMPSTTAINHCKGRFWFFFCQSQQLDMIVNM